jgi:hypothetical protein
MKPKTSVLHTLEGDQLEMMGFDNEETKKNFSI